MEKEYSKYEELKADDGIPNKKELLEAELNYRKKGHDNNVMWWVNGVKDHCTFGDLFRIKLQHCYHNDGEMFADKNLNLLQLIIIKLVPRNIFKTSPQFNNMCFRLNKTYPTDLQRALRFRKRIKELEEQSKTEINQ